MWIIITPPNTLVCKLILLYYSNYTTVIQRCSWLLYFQIFYCSQTHSQTIIRVTILTINLTTLHPALLLIGVFPDMLLQSNTLANYQKSYNINLITLHPALFLIGVFPAILLQSNTLATGTVCERSAEESIQWQHKGGVTWFTAESVHQWRCQEPEKY